MTLEQWVYDAFWYYLGAFIFMMGVMLYTDWVERHPENSDEPD
jgi:hypothetical protein